MTASIDPAPSAAPPGSTRQRSFATVTELSGEPATADQMRRLYNRYLFASSFCEGKDVLELACGSGQGLGFLARFARSIVGTDIDEEILAIARTTYEGRIPLKRMDAEEILFPDASLDVVILFEAIYYLPRPERFASEAWRVLRPGGAVLVCTANPDLPDFNPSPFRQRYFNPPELVELFETLGFQAECYGEDPVPIETFQDRAIRFLKMCAVRFHMIPRTMAGKKYLKRIVYGDLVPIPAEVHDGMAPVAAPLPIPSDRPDATHRVIHCVARKP